MNKIINGVANDFEFDGIETFNRWQDPTINELQQQLDKYKNVIEKIKKEVLSELQMCKPKDMAISMEINYIEEKLEKLLEEVE